MKLSRLVQIEQYIIKNETVTLDELCQAFGVSKNTIRRDINELEINGSIRKVYGGVTSAAKKTLIPFEQRNIKNKNEKIAIAKASASYVNDGDVIYIDSGTTVPNMVFFLKDKSITILTCSLNAVVNALPFPNINVISLGGTLARKTNSFTGINLAVFRNFNINKAFMATTGISITNGVTNSSPLEYEVKKTIVQKSNEVLLLADHSKLGVSSLMTYCSMDDIDIFITECKPSEEYLRFLEDSHTEIKIAASTATDS
jgi:DeoR family myo-inositol catabolism operon transcriptional repressor